MSSGGARQGAGRKAGVPNKRTLVDREKAAKSGELPLDYMLRVMRDSKKPWERRDEMARSAAPYLHPKLSSVVVGGKLDHTVTGEVVIKRQQVVNVVVALLDGRASVPVVDVKATEVETPRAEVLKRLTNGKGNGRG